MRIIEINPNLYIGDAELYEFGKEALNSSDWLIIQAQKEPYHRQALGYTGRAAPKGHAEYLYAWRGNRLIMNLIDAQQGGYVPAELFNRGVEAIRDGLHAQKKVLVHCQEGASRAPGLVMAYLGLCKLLPPSFPRAFERFKEDYYPYVNLGNGIYIYLAQNWAIYAGAEETAGILDSDKE